jgi:outer membrane immunogenic protein
MKNLILSCAIGCVAVICNINQTFAQTNKTRFGVKIGADLMTLGSASGSGISAVYNYRPGFQGGFYVETPLSAKVIFSPQLLYAQKGGNFIGSISGINVTGSSQVNYIDLPILFAFKLESNLSFFAGPQVSFLLSQQTIATATLSGMSSTKTDNSTDGLRKTVFGLNLGAGYKFNENIGVNLHYVVDLQNAAETGSNDTGEKNSGFALTVGFLF